MKGLVFTYFPLNIRNDFSKQCKRQMMAMRSSPHRRRNETKLPVTFRSSSRRTLQTNQFCQKYRRALPQMLTHRKGRIFWPSSIRMTKSKASVSHSNYLRNLVRRSLAMSTESKSSSSRAIKWHKSASYIRSSSRTEPISLIMFNCPTEKSKSLKFTRWTRSYSKEKQASS